MTSVRKMNKLPWKRVLLHSIVLILCLCPGLVTVLSLWEMLPEEVRIAILAFSWLMTIIYIISLCCCKNAHVILILTIIQCASPICGFGAKAIFNTTLVFGPGMSVALNLIGVLSTLICLIGLFVKEKLMIIKVILLPIFKTFEDLQLSKLSFRELMAELWKHTTSIFSAITSLLPSPDTVIDWVTADPLSIGKSLHGQVSKACTNTANIYIENCPKWLNTACQQHGGFFAFIGKCPTLVNSSCFAVIPNIDVFCEMKLLDPQLLGQHVAGMRYALGNISQAIETGNSTAILGLIDGRLPDLEMMILKAIPYVKMSLWILFGIFMAVVIFQKFRLACLIARRYYTDLGLENDYLDLEWVRKHRPEVLPLTKRERVLFQESVVQFFGGCLRSLFTKPKTLVKNFSLVLIVLTVVAANLALAEVHEFAQRFNITVPIEGHAGFQFNVQGTSTLARLLSLVLKGFNIISQDCEIADGSKCMSQHRPLDHGSMALLWTLAIFYCFSDKIKKRQYYILCRFCDFICPKQAAKRAEYLTDYMEEKRRKVGVLVEKLLTSFESLDKKTKKSLTCSKTPNQQGRAIESFYENWGSKLRWMPRFLVNAILHKRYGVWNLNCQICWTDCIVVQCQCALFCEECASFIHDENNFCSICETDANVLYNP